MGNEKSATGESSVVEYAPIFNQSFEATVLNTRLNKNNLVNGGTVTQGNAMAILGTSTTTASTAQLESVAPGKYRPGLGGMIRFTVLFSAPVAGTKQLIGIADEKGSAQPNKIKVGKISRSQLEKIAKQKMADLNTDDLATAQKTIEGTAKSLGITVE